MPTGRSHLTKENHNHWKGGKPKCIVCSKELSNYRKTYKGNPVLGACSKCRWIIKPKTNLGGYKLSDEFKEKQRQRMLGNQYTTGMFVGEKSPLWKGGITPLNKKIRASTEYKKWREAVFKRDDYRCMYCGERGGELEADHIYPFAYFPRLRFDIYNGQTLCKPCHKTTPTYGGKAISYSTINFHQVSTA